MSEEYEHKILLNGVQAFVFSVIDKGDKITLSGWRHDRSKFKPGDRILIIQKNGQSTRYLITEMRCPMDPPDQYFMDCEFYPRLRKGSPTVSQTVTRSHLDSHPEKQEKQNDIKHP